MTPDRAEIARGWMALRRAVEAIGWLGLLTLCLGGAHATASGKPVDWSLFFSGGLWIGLPLVVGVRAYLTKGNEHGG